MEKLFIRGGLALSGEVSVAGSKNAALPIMAATILSGGCVRLRRLAQLSDIFFMAELLEKLGGAVLLEKPSVSDMSLGMSAEISFGSVANLVADYDLVRKMRAGVLVLGPLLARYGRAEVSLPGGCAIGTRPVNLHLDGLRALGADIDVSGGYICATAERGLRGCHFCFEKVSVGASENVLMAACLSSGESLLENVACEPEISDLANFLVSMGARIDGIGSDCLRVEGVSELHGCEHRIIADRIECGTLAIACVACGGDIVLRDCIPEHLSSLWGILRECGAEVDLGSDYCRIRMAEGRRAKALEITTEPYPGFPTDLQAQLMALLSVGVGVSRIHESIFENRFMHVSELIRLGADISIDGHDCTIRGVDKLESAQVMATDLRASASLIIAALVASGTTEISRIYHLDRGYEFSDKKFRLLSADIRRV